MFLQSSYKLLEMSVYKKSHICILELLKKYFSPLKENINPKNVKEITLADLSKYKKEKQGTSNFIRAN